MKDECSASEAGVGRHCLRLKSVLRVTITWWKVPHKRKNSLSAKETDIVIIQ